MISPDFYAPLRSATHIRAHFTVEISKCIIEYPAALRTRRPNVTVEDFEIVDINRGTCTNGYRDVLELGRNGVNPPPFEESLRNYGTFLAFGYGIFITNESAYQAEAINTAYTARFSAAMLDHDTSGLLQSIS
jgi:hypothetical protein